MSTCSFKCALREYSPKGEILHCGFKAFTCSIDRFRQDIHEELHRIYPEIFPERRAFYRTCSQIHCKKFIIIDKEGDEIEWSVESFGYNSSPYFNVAPWMESEFVNGDKIKMLIVTDLVHSMDSSTSAIALDFGNRAVTPYQKPVSSDNNETQIQLQQGDGTKLESTIRHCIVELEKISSTGIANSLKLVEIEKKLTLLVYQQEESKVKTEQALQEMNTKIEGIQITNRKESAGATPSSTLISSGDLSNPSKHGNRRAGIDLLNTLSPATEGQEQRKEPHPNYDSDSNGQECWADSNNGQGWADIAESSRDVYDDDYCDHSDY